MILSKIRFLRFLDKKAGIYIEFCHLYNKTPMILSKLCFLRFLYNKDVIYIEFGHLYNKSPIILSKLCFLIFLNNKDVIYFIECCHSYNKRPRISKSLEMSSFKIKQ